MDSILHTVLVVLLLVPGLILSALVALRLIGIRRSWSAAGAIGGLGIALGLVTAIGITSRDPAEEDFILVALLATLIGTMVVSVLRDLLAKPRDRQAPLPTVGTSHLPRPIARVKAATDEARRTREIIAIAGDNGFHLLPTRRNRELDAEAARREPAELRLQRTLEECGGMFVKLGQVASTRTDLFPPEVIEVLARLQSQVAPEDPADMRELIETELGAPVDDVFAEFDWDPIAAASIGQVYKATLRTGEPVVVKAQRPRVAELVERDSRVLLRVARTAEEGLPIARQYGAVALAEEFIGGLREELDFRIEQRNTIEMARNMADEVGIRIPEVYAEHCTARLMVQERFVGVDISDTAAVDASGRDREVLADHLLHAAMTQMVTDGFFHADLHPGNLLLLEDGSIGMIDFGSTGRLDPLLLSSLQEMLLAVATRDAGLLRQSVTEICDIDPDVDADALERALSRFMATHLSGGGIDAAAVRELLGMLTTFGIRVPADLTLFSRALVVLEGSLGVVCPGYRLAEHAEAMGQELLVSRSGTDDPEELAKAELIKLAPTLRRLPRRMDRIGDMLQAGTLSTRVSLFSGSDGAFLTRLTNRLLLALVGSVLGLMAVLLLVTSNDQGPALASGVSLLHVLGLLTLLVSAVLLLRVVSAAIREGI